MKRKGSLKIAIHCGRAMSRLFYKFPISTDPFKFCEMQLLDDNDLDIIMEIWWSTSNENSQPVELFAELVDLEPVKNDVEDFSDLDVDKVPNNIDDKGPEEVEDVHGPSFNNPSRGIILRNEPRDDMLNVDPNATHVFEFPEYADIVHAHRLTSISQLKELFVGQQFENKVDCVFVIKQYSMKFLIDYKVVKSTPTLYVRKCWRAGGGVVGGFGLHLYRRLNSGKYEY
ncbi:hypothetical protein J1N35_033350 [Gossypium stocksii]|uniref:Transposase MuDR plant domain-containing protein n=1 Tax=Gossypium stocksii TaxID=47602 RepID=A0A9D3ZPI6_9ROSI|nr:hypothetical protein J1N35_033350 [Gossypium stocksii]